MWQRLAGSGHCTANPGLTADERGTRCRNPGHRPTRARLCVRQVTQGDGSGVGDGGSGGWCDSGQRQ